MNINSGMLNRRPRRTPRGDVFHRLRRNNNSSSSCALRASVQTLFLSLLGVFNVSAATVPIQESFETFLDGTALNASSLTNQGWGASSNTVAIRTVSVVPDSVRGTNALAIPEGLTASNVVTSVTANTNVWVDMFVNTNMTMSVNLIGDESVDTNLTVEVFLNTNGCPVVWNPASNAWIVCSQDAWQTNVSVFNTSQWARITLCENYSNKTASLFLNEHLIMTGLRFIDTNKTSYSMFAADSGSALTSYVDEVSVAYAPPANMADVDNDGMSEAMEIQLYGNTTTRSWRTVTVTATNHGTVTPFAPFSMRPGGQTNFVLTADPGYYVADALTNGQSVGSFPGQFTNSTTYTWTGIVSDGLVDGTFGATFLRDLQLTAAVSHVGGPSLTGGALTLSTNEVFPGGQVVCAMTGETGYVVSSVLTNGTVETTFSGGARIRSYTLTNIWAGMTVTAVFTYSANLSVTNDYPTLQTAVAAAMDGTIIHIVGGSYTNDVTLDKSVTLQGTNVTILGSLGIQSGMTGTLAGCVGMVVTGGVTVANGALLVVSNGSVDVGTITIQAGATVQVVNATAFVVDGATRSGTFTLDSGWGSTVVPQTPPYSDSFERYALGTKLSRMGYYGWDTTSNNVVIQNTYAQSNQAVEIPARASLASAMTATPASNVWFELYYQDTNRIPASMATLDIVDTNVAVMAFINTNGYVTVFEPVSNQWDVCSNDAQSVAVSNLALDAWVRITVNENYTRGKAAVFLNGRLLRQELRFINTNLVNSGRFHVDSGISGPTYLDTYSVRTNWVGILSTDGDDDGWPDAMEIDQYGNTAKSPGVGSVYTIR